MNKIQRVSFYFRLIFQCFFCIIPLTLILFWVFLPANNLGVDQWFGMVNYIPEGIQNKIINPLPGSTKLLGFLISLIPVTVSEIILFLLIRLFRHYEKNEIFNLKSVNYIKKIGRTLLVGCMLAPIHEVLLSAALTWHNPVGQRVAVISMSSSSVVIILTSLMIILISWIMSEACQLKDEQQLTI